MMDPARRDISIVTIKKLCGRLAITSGDLFAGEVFDPLEQEIK